MLSAIARCRCPGARNPNAPGLPMLSLTRVRPCASSSRARRASSPRISYRTSDRRSRVFRLGGDIGGRGMDVAAKPSGKTPPAPHHPPMHRTLVNDGFRFALPILRVLLRLESGHGHRPLPRLNPDFAPLRVIGWPWEGRSEEHTSDLQSLMRISYAVFCLK